VIVTVSFGSPSNRSIREGYWESPKGIPGYTAEIRLKDSSKAGRGEHRGCRNLRHRSLGQALGRNARRLLRCVGRGDPGTETEIRHSRPP